MASVIKLKRSSTPGSVPSSLEAGELAINIPDKKLFSSDGSSVFNVSGDLYNAVTQANPATGGADIVLTVDNAALSDDVINLVGSTSVGVSRAANGAIVFASTGTGTVDGFNSAVTVQLSGDVTGSATFDSGGDVANITTTIADNSLVLGTATTGDYVASLVAGTDMVVTNNAGETATPTVALADSIAANTSGTAAKATILETARNIGGVSFNGSANITLPGVDAAGNQDTTGNAATATALETSRTIGSVPFDGTANINLPGVNALGNQNTTGSAATLTTPRAIAVSGEITGTANFDGSAGITISTTMADSIVANTSGTAAKATILETARTIAISGDQVGSASFDGSGNINIATQTQADSVDLGTHTTGNYVAAVTGTANEIAVTGTGEGASVQVGLPTDVTIGNDLSVTNDLDVTGNLTLGGNLEVNGTLTYINSTTVTIGDNMLKLANTNNSDTIDTGFYVQYDDGAQKFAGLIRDASDGSFHLFDGLTTEPDQTINFGATATATLNANIDGGTY